MTKILVTGASGFIGKHLILKLCNSNSNIIESTRSDGDIAEKSTWSSFERADVVIHLAGSTFVPDSWNNPDAFMRTNFHGTVCALEYCRQHGAKLVFLSSYLYGNPNTLPTPESAVLIANNPYGLSKKLAEEVCKFYADYYGLKITILRPFNVYGPGQPAQFLIPSIINQVRLGGIISIKQLEPKRDYIFVEDLVDAIIKASAAQLDFNVFNIGTGVNHSVGDLIDMIQNIMGTNLPVMATGETRVEEIMETQAEITRAYSVLGWVPRYSLFAGLQKLVS